MPGNKKVRKYLLYFLLSSMAIFFLVFYLVQFGRVDVYSEYFYEGTVRYIIGVLLISLSLIVLAILFKKNPKRKNNYKMEID